VRFTAQVKGYLGDIAILAVLSQALVAVKGGDDQYCHALAFSYAWPAAPLPLW